MLFAAAPSATHGQPNEHRRGAQRPQVEAGLAPEYSPGPGPWLDHARRVARETFGVPSCGQPRIVRGDPVTYAGGAQAEWLGHATAWADPERCAIVLNRSERFRTSWRFCHVLVHEWGHLVLGGEEAHSDDSGSVMFPDVLGVEGKIKVRGRWRWSAVGFYPACKPRSVTRRGGARVGGWTT